MKLIKEEKYKELKGDFWKTTKPSQVIVGNKKTYSYLHYIIKEYLPYKGNKFYIVSGFKNDFKLDGIEYSKINGKREYKFENNFDEQKVKNIEEIAFKQMMDKINSTDISSAVNLLNKTPKFTRMVNLISEGGKNEPIYIAFMEVLRDFYSYWMPEPFSINVIAKIAMKKGMKIESLDQINDFIYWNKKLSNSEIKYKNGGNIQRHFTYTIGGL